MTWPMRQPWGNSESTLSTGVSLLIAIVTCSAFCNLVVAADDAHHSTISAIDLKWQLPQQWEYTVPLISPEKRATNPSRAQKDPTVVFYAGKWHVFMTVKLPGRSAIEYCSFKNWEQANASRRVILDISDSDYYCAPQVFYFTPHKKWYLVYQMGVAGQDKMWVAYSTTSDIKRCGIVDTSKAHPRWGTARFTHGRRTGLLDHL